MLEKLKQRWNLKTNWDVIAVLLVFSVNGSFATFIRKPLFNYLNFSKETVDPDWVYYFVRFFSIFVIYQTTFPLVGWLFGQFKFAWDFEKKFLRRIGFGFLFKD